MSDVLYEKHADGHYAVFTLNRPQRLNAINGTLMGDLLRSVEDFTRDPAMRVGILTGAGRAFCAGADIRENVERQEATAALQAQRERGEITQAELDRRLAEMTRGTAPVRFDVFSSNPKPFIAAINGLALGGGMHWAMDCDIRIATPEAFLGLPEPKIGLAAGYGSQYLGEMVPLGEALYYLLTSDRISAEEAVRLGLVHQTVEPERLLPRAAEIAGMIAEGAPLAIEAAKALAYFRRRQEAAARAAYAEPLSQRASNSEDVLEGRRAFVEKRKPVWQGR
jgi:enoyl-CoA hydratase/carnithine racemase